MAPHDASSPTGSYTAGFNHFSFRQAQSSELRMGDISPTGSQASLSSSYDSSTLEPAAHAARPLLPGVPHHAVRLARAGVTGLATQGSNGEAVHLTHAERQLVTATTRQALDDAGFRSMPIIVGCGSQSTRETIQYCKEAWAVGGDYALVLPPSYYAPLFAPSSETVLEFFNKVADASPIPIIIYNFPGAVGGMDLSSDTIITLSSHANIVGVKLTFTRRGGHGILAGLANIAPRACIRTIELFRAGKVAEAQKFQDVVSQGDWTAIQGGVVGVKAGLQAWMGYGGSARSPLPKPTAEQTKRWQSGFKELVLLEKTL
ncbi:dihydrodipicolinate synthase [Verticillium dahliae]|nr:dihydrodipicolinate synthase [Verticillium dahliae]